jgi:hypothetical protein
MNKDRKETPNGCGWSQGEPGRQAAAKHEVHESFIDHCIAKWQEWKHHREAATQDERIENLVRFLNASIDEPVMRQQVLSITMLESSQRVLLIDSILDSVNLKGAPPELTDALKCLKDDEVALKARRILGAE